MKHPLWAVVPYKGTANSKQRLSGEFSNAERAGLVHAMLDDVLTQLTQTSLFDGIVLVSRARDAEEIARRYGISSFKDHTSSLREALIAASRWTKAVHAAETVFIVPADVPLLSKADIQHAIQRHEQVTVIPDKREIGTNALICSPPNAFPYIFDGSSFKPHIVAAKKHGLNPKVLKLRSFSIDVDTAVDLQGILDSDDDSVTKKYLEQIMQGCHSR